MGFFLRKKHLWSSVEPSLLGKRACSSSTWLLTARSLLLSFISLCVWRREGRRKCLALVQDWREGQKLQLGSCKLIWVGLGTVYFRVFMEELPPLLKSCHLLLLSCAGDQTYIELSLWACAAGWESWCYSSATLVSTAPSGKWQQPSLCNAGVLLQW